MKRSSIAWGGVLVAMALTVVTGSFFRPVVADEEDAEVSGVVTAVGGNTLPASMTVETVAGPVTVTLTAATDFELDDEDSDTEDDEDQDGRDDDEEGDEDALRLDPSGLIGKFVHVEYDAATALAEEVEVETEFETFGRVQSVGGNTLPTTVTIRQFGGPVLTVTVTSDTEIEIEGEGDEEDVENPTDLSALIGRFVEVEYDPSTGVAKEIETESDNELALGSIASIDLATRTLVVRTDSGDVSFTVNSDTDIDLNFQDADLASLQAGQQVLVEFELEDGSRVAEHINAVTPAAVPLAATVANVSTTSSTVSLQNARSRRGRGPMLLKVNAGTDIRVNGRRASLADIPAGSRVKAKFVPSNGVAVARKLMVQVPRRRR